MVAVTENNCKHSGDRAPTDGSAFLSTVQSRAMVPATASRVLTVAFSGLLGLVVGSFLNVVVYRLPLGMSVVRPPSHCPACGAELKAMDNVPLLSWLVLLGRCRHCRAPIPARYPLVELATGVAFAGMAWSLVSLRPLPSLLVVLAATVAASAVDLDGPPIPWSLLVAGGLGAASLAVVAAAAGQPGRLGWALAGGVASGAIALMADRTQPGIRRACAAAFLGWSAGWLWAPGGLVLACWVGSVAGVSVALALWHRRGAGRPAGEDKGRGGPGLAVSGRGAIPLVLVAVAAFGLLLAGAAL